MEDQDFYMKSNDLKNNEVVYFTQDDIPIFIDVENFVLPKNHNENSKNLDDLNEFTVSTVETNDEDVTSTSEELNISSNFSAQVKKPAKHWTQKHITIKTIESEFKVVMWVLDDSKENENESTAELEQLHPSEEPKQSPKTIKYFSINKSSKIMWNNKNKNDSSLPKHLLQKSNPNKSLMNSCTFKNCPKSFKDMASLRKHLHTHGPKTKICAECGKAFIDNSKLKRHLVVHTGDKPFKCYFAGCGKKFSLDYNLRTHTRIHTNYRPFACTFQGCNKRFAQSTNLKSHRLTHMKKLHSDDKDWSN